MGTKAGFFGKVGTTAGHVKLDQDGATVTGRVKPGTGFEQDTYVFDAELNKSRAPRDSDDPTEIITKHVLTLITREGAEVRLSGSNNMFKRFRKLADSLTGDIYDYYFTCTRDGAKGSKDTIYLWSTAGEVTAADLAKTDTAKDAAPEITSGRSTGKPAAGKTAPATDAIAARKAALAAKPKPAPAPAPKAPEDMDDDEFMAAYGDQAAG